MNAILNRPKSAGAETIPVPPRVIATPIDPEFIRLPKPGTNCAYTGMSRSALNELVLPTIRNNYKPPVRSFCIRQRGAATGIRLIDYKSLISFIREHEDLPGEPVPA